jgi:hypothetical protein
MHRSSHQPKGTLVNHTTPVVKTTSLGIGSSGTVGGVRGSDGSGVEFWGGRAALLRLALLTVVAVVAFLALAVGSASAATIYKQVGEIPGPFGSLKSESIAVNTHNGHIYIADSSNGKVFDFESAADTTPEIWEGFGGGRVAVAVDNASGDVYVADSTDAVIEKFDDEGNLIAGFGDHETLGVPDPDGTLAGLKTPPASFLPPEAPLPADGGTFGIAVDQSTHNLYAIDAGHHRVDVFDEAGAYLEALTETLAVGVASAEGEGLFGCSGKYADGIAVNDGSGQLLLSDSCTVKGFRIGLSSGTFLGAIEELGDGYTTITADNAGGKAYASDTAAETVKGLNTDGSADGSQIEAINARGLAVDQSTGDVYAAESNNGSVRIFEALAVPDVETLPPTAPGQTSAILHGHVDPIGNGPIIDCHFVVSGGVGNVPCDQATPITAAEAVSATVTGLAPNTNYTYRLVAANAEGANEGASVPLRTLGPPLIESLSASDVSATAATLEATIDPEGFPTTYHFAYITEAAWLADGEAFGAGTTSVPVPDQPIGAGNSGIALTVKLNGLAPSTPYRYRVIAASAQGPSSSESSLITQAASNPLLPDTRGYELVSPVDKFGSLISPIAEEGLIQSAPDGGAITYLANGPVEPHPEGNSRAPQVLSLRGAIGWSSKQIAIPHQAPTGAATGGGQDYRFFSGDLRNALIQPGVSAPFPPPGSFASLSPDATEQTPYVRTNIPSGTSFCVPGAEACYRPLVTAAPGLADVPPGTVFGEKGGPNFLGATDDLAHVIVQSNVALTETPVGEGGGLYEWTANLPPSQQVQLVSLLPGSGSSSAPGRVELGSAGSSRRGAIGPEGDRVFWEGTLTLHSPQRSLYVRDLSLGQTLQLDAVQGGSGGGDNTPGFQIANAAADRVFFIDNQQLRPGSGFRDLYECHLVEAGGQLTCDLTDLTPLGPGGEEAGMLGGVLGISEDGRAVYFVANGALTTGEGAVKGNCGEVPLPTQSCNLYHYDSSTGQTRLVAVLSGADSPDWGEKPAFVLNKLTARVSSNGRYLAFQSQRPLTGYDNRDGASGERDEEVFLYDNQTGNLSCPSCNPSGGRPHGSLSRASLQRASTQSWPRGTWLAATVPGWTSYRLGESLYQPRYLSNSGRLFFNAFDALAPEDSNGTADVYQYEPAGVGSCNSADHGYVPASNACVDLISSGTSPEESGFLDASESGDDVFFLTSSALTSKDKDQIGDVYDARVGGGETAGAQPVQCEGDGCQQPAVPPNDSTPGSLSFNGAGNVLECPKGKVKKGGKCVKKQAKKHKHKKHHKKKGKGKKKSGSSNRGVQR